MEIAQGLVIALLTASALSTLIGGIYSFVDAREDGLGVLCLCLVVVLLACAITVGQFDFAQAVTTAEKVP